MPFFLLSCEGQYEKKQDISRVEYHEKLQGFWLGQCIANWTGLMTENQKTTPPGPSHQYSHADTDPRWLAQAYQDR
jgi:hypothetical protein